MSWCPDFVFRGTQGCGAARSHGRGRRAERSSRTVCGSTCAGRTPPSRASLFCRPLRLSRHRRHRHLKLTTSVLCLFGVLRYVLSFETEQHLARWVLRLRSAAVDEPTAPTPRPMPESKAATGSDRMAMQEPVHAGRVLHIDHPLPAAGAVTGLRWAVHTDFEQVGSY